MGLALAVVLSAVPYDFRTHALHFPERVQEVSMIQPASQGVVMFVMDDLLNDPRVQREARSAVRAGFQVTVIALQSDRCRIERETVEAGWNRVAGTSADTVEAAARMTLDEV